MISTMGKNTNNNNATKFNVTFGIKGQDPIPANAAVLLNERKMRVNGEFKMVTEFMAVEGVKSTAKEDLVLPVLAVMLADARSKGGFNSMFKIAVVNGTEYKTGINAANRFTKWLKGNCIYKSNSQHELNKALVLDNGLYLRNTALNVKPKHALYTESDKDVIRVLLHQTAKAIVKEATMFKDILTDAKSIFDTAYATPAETKKSNTKQATA